MLQQDLYKKQASSQLILPRGKESGHLSWKSPSNIAIVKYWGKKANQLPQNPNLSITLSESYTLTELDYAKRNHSEDISLDFYFEGRVNPVFKSRIEKYLRTLLSYFPFLLDFHLTIRSSNSFPHSSGIASSASAMSALALCLCSLESELRDDISPKKDFFKKASFIARLGSGSACRSIYPGAALWGKTEHINVSSDDYAIGIHNLLHPTFKDIRDAIVIVSDEVKSVSSSAGHNLMNDNPYSKIRYQVAKNRLARLLDILQAGDWDSFGELAEQEAFDLHGLMMSSKPSYILMKPQTIAIIHEIRRVRKYEKIPIYFTLDAGPNVHILYPGGEQARVNAILTSDHFMNSGHHKVIMDRMGHGPELQLQA